MTSLVSPGGDWLHVVTSHEMPYDVMHVTHEIEPNTFRPEICFGWLNAGYSCFYCMWENWGHFVKG